MKAVVLETRGRRAALLLRDGTVRLCRGRFQVGEVVDIAEAARPGLRQWAAAAVAAMFLLGGSAGLWARGNLVACAEVSLDVNPSIIYTINRRSRVLDVRAANADGETLVESLNDVDLRFMPLSDAVTRTLDVLEDEGYLSAEQADYVLVSVSTDEEARQDHLVAQVEEALTRAKTDDPTLEYRIDRTDLATAREAEANGMSAGRYVSWREAAGSAGEGEAPRLDAFDRMSVRELLDEAKGEASNRDDAPEQVSEEPPRAEARPMDEKSENAVRIEPAPEAEEVSRIELVPEAEDAIRIEAVPEGEDAARIGKAPETRESTPKEVSSPGPREAESRMGEPRGDVPSHEEGPEPRDGGENHF